MSSFEMLRQVLLTRNLELNSVQYYLTELYSLICSIQVLLTEINWMMYTIKSLLVAVGEAFHLLKIVLGLVGVYNLVTKLHYPTSKQLAHLRVLDHYHFVHLLSFHRPGGYSVAA